MKKKSNKLRRLEQNRYSILTDDLEHCYWCYEQDESIVPKDDLHEIYGGSNRQRSMIHGFVIPLCRQHHRHVHNNKEAKEFLQRFCQITYEETHTREEFIKIIGKSYL